MLSTINISSSRGPYDVVFPDLLKDWDFSKMNLNSDHYVIADDALWKRYAKYFSAWNEFPKFLVPANEETKTLQMVERLSQWLIAQGATKTSTLIALGGGVIQDLTTFTASIFHRGCSWEYYPTTLLSQADSCIGSKCGINVLPHKNQLGVVYAPQRVTVIEEILNSLPSTEIMSGYGEIFKLSVIGSDSFYQLLKDSLANNLELPKGEVLGRLIRASLVAKKQIIEEDEHENGLRRVLNYGHSFGHALETLSNNKLSHGLAVVFGMDLINYLGVTWGITRPEFYEDFGLLLAKYYKNSISLKDVSAEKLVKQLRTDKKMSFGTMYFAVPVTEGDFQIVPKLLDKNLEYHVDKYLKEQCVFLTS